MLQSKIDARLAFLDLTRIDVSGVSQQFRISGEPIFDDRDQFKGYRGITRDISARKQSEALIRESNRFARTILDALDTPIAVLDQAGVVLASNRAWRASAAARS